MEGQTAVKMVNIKLDGRPYAVPEGTTILEAARQAGIDIPTLCYMKEINEIGACRICVVEVKGARSLVTACVYPVNEGMEVFTNTEKVRASRRTNLELVLSTHNQNCLGCVRSGACELQALCQRFGVEKTARFAGAMPTPLMDTSALHMYRDNSKCILCRRCVAACAATQAVGCIGTNERGFDTHIACAFEAPLSESPCVSCGQCIIVCPTGALQEKDDTQKVWDALANPQKHVIVQTAPSVRATLGEEFGMPIGTDVEGKMVAALKRLGFAGVFDTDFAADMTIIEEGTEFLGRLQNGGKLPMITSCSPGWVNYCEIHHPEFIENMSTCKSPQQMFGALSKTYYAEKMGLDPKDIVTVSVMPCVAKKYEMDRPEMTAAGEGIADVDVVVTTRELARMIRKAGLDFVNLPDEQYDPAMGEASGAGVIFGATGGVMEAALRTAVEKLSGQELQHLDFQAVRGTQGIKEASYDVAGRTIRVCAASGLSNANKVLEDVKAGRAQYDFIEIMGCPGGCVNGGGQPIQPAKVRDTVNLAAERAKALYNNDKAKTVRKSHENPLVQKVYKEFLGEPNGHKAHELLHTHYHHNESKY